MRFRISAFLSLCLLLSCSSEITVIDNDETPLTMDLKEFSFLSSDNNLLDKDIHCDIIGDTLIECWIPQLLESKELVPHVVYDADTCLLDSRLYVEKILKVDFRKQVLLKLKKHGIRKDYKVQVHSFTGLPIMWLNTKENAEINSKEDYNEATLTIKEDIALGGAETNLNETKVFVKGRGHTTWNLYPKKPYRFKFDEKVSVLSMPKDKSWVLIANYYDNTLIRNHIAYWLGSISLLDYTPRFKFVELVLNGLHKGVYQIGEKMKISKNRVNVGDDGFLLEMACNEGEDKPYFETEYMPYPLYVKDPDLAVGDDNYNYIKQRFNQAEWVLYSDFFKDPDNGWQKYYDVSSFVDYYLINEITKNVDAVKWTSTYFSISRTDKIKMGPLWDFDSALGNEVYDGCDAPEDFYTRRFGYYPRLFEDPFFVSKVKERFNFFYSVKEDMLFEIDSMAEYLKRSAEYNNNIWNTLYNDEYGTHHLQGGYNKEIEWLKEWILARFEWLKVEFDKM